MTRSSPALSTAWLPTRAVLGIVRITGCHIHPGEPCSAWAQPDRVHVDLDDVHPLALPIRAIGSSDPGACRSACTSASCSNSLRRCTTFSRRSRHEPQHHQVDRPRLRQALPVPVQPLPDQLGRARRACSGCPIARECLRWSLVQKPITKQGIYAATTPSQRTALRGRVADRLGPDWIDVLAAHEQTRREWAATARQNPLTVNQARIVRLDREVNGPMPRRQKVTSAQQQRNMARLMAGLAAQPLPFAPSTSSP
ncbi:WhiB family transcriptional regulator [Streptomyces sp. NPDC058739]|uniref:WhiB family transcriptional regulator n=1 Tax=Streptomyces sp. NPDC058739 TaxID=3346618 RepID=UPI00369F88DA